MGMVNYEKGKVYGVKIKKKDKWKAPTEIPVNWLLQLRPPSDNSKWTSDSPDSYTWEMFEDMVGKKMVEENITGQDVFWRSLDMKNVYNTVFMPMWVPPVAEHPKDTEQNIIDFVSSFVNTGNSSTSDKNTNGGSSRYNEWR